MNYLAHLLLADDTDASRIGNLLGDFTRGSLDELAKFYPEEVVRGIKMHRAIDRFTDDHPIFKKGRALLDSEHSRYAGIVIDIFYDHLLCVHWQKFSTVPLEGFIQQVYHALEQHPEWHAGRLAEVFPSMQSENWLMRYSTLDGIEYTLKRVSQRSPRVIPVASSITALRENYHEFEALFLEFMPELIEFTTQWKKQN